MGIPGVRIRARANQWRVEAASIEQLQQLCVTSVGAADVTCLKIRVAKWSPPKGWVGAPTSPGLVAYLVEPRGAGAQVILTWHEPVDVALALAAALRCLRPINKFGVGSMLTLAPGLPAAAAALAAGTRDVLLPERAIHGHLRRCDTLVVPTPDSMSEVERAVTVVVASETWIVDGAAYLVAVDPSVHNPIGRRSMGATEVITASVAGEALKLRGSKLNLVIAGDLRSGDVEALRSMGVVTAEDDLGPRWTNQLRACGLVLKSGSAIDDSTKTSLVDPLEAQVLSVKARHDALRGSTPAAALGCWPSVSAVLLTNRETYLTHSMQQIAKLDYPNLQVVVGLHGLELTSARIAELKDLAGREIEFISISSNLSFGAAMQLVSQSADGELITKMDDDDYYGSNHLWDLVLARMYSGAQVVGKALDWIYLEGEDTTVFRPTYAAEKYSFFVAGGTILISRADLDAVGGWRPVSKSIDRALLESVKQVGGLIYRTHGLGYIYVRHLAPHTASVSSEHFLSKTERTWPGLLRHQIFGTAQ
ncbi:unannotated protein [freshwater metagenome]|uniref:Unannotated protein n=1 Tax=freshwater metagenome TaxID=449393 RepID=A0A6J7RKU9_9ZZZZ|nr:hypothetical protein [Actinomycetota bacterium]